MSLLDRGVVVFEFGVVDPTVEAYAFRHLPFDIDVAAVSKWSIESRRVGGEGNERWVLTTYHVTGRQADGSPIDQILLFCFHYDPAEGRYGPVIMSFVRLGGVLTVLALGTFFAVLWRGEKRRLRLSVVGQDSNPDMSKACQDWNPDPQPERQRPYRG